jgi:hypothetical protein
MKIENQIKEAETSNSQSPSDAAREALAAFHGSGQGGSVVRLLADRKAEITGETGETFASPLEYRNSK